MFCKKHFIDLFLDFRLNTGKHGCMPTCLDSVSDLDFIPSKLRDEEPASPSLNNNQQVSTKTKISQK